MNISKKPGETNEAFRARAFTANRQHVDPLVDAQATNPVVQAIRMTRDEWRATGTPLAFGPVYPISQVRAILWGAGLVFGVTCIVMAVFGYAS